MADSQLTSMSTEGGEEVNLPRQYYGTNSTNSFTTTTTWTIVTISTDFKQ